MDKDKLKQIRWFSNGIWQFQPHLHFLSNLVDKDAFEAVMQRMENKEVVSTKGFYFKLEDNNVGKVESV